VVLGYDESPGAVAALEVAIEVASRYGEELVLVYGAAPPGARNSARTGRRCGSWAVPPPGTRSNVPKPPG